MNANDFLDEQFDSMAYAAERIPASQQLRDAVLGRTTRTIRNRRRMRRAGLAAALVGCYLGGIATTSLRPAARNADGNTGTVARKAVRPEDDQIVADSEQSKAKRITPYERLRRAGDQQLERFENIPAATRTYQKALQMASADQRAIAPEHDTWLLMALKQSSNLN
jgi:hypothetical protein